MHENARRFDHYHTKRDGERGTILPPPAHRPCDYCGEPVGKEGMFIHDYCMQLERQEILERAQYEMVYGRPALRPRKSA